MPADVSTMTFDWSSPVFQAAIKTALVGGLGATIAVAGGFLLCLLSWISYGFIRHGILYLGSAFLLVPPYAIAGAWSSSGGIDGWLSISPVATAQSMPLAIFAVAWIHGVSKMPLVLLLLATAVLRTNFQTFEQARIDQRPTELFYKYMPATFLPWIVLAWTLCAMLINSDMVISNLYQVETLTESSYLNASLGRTSAMIDLGSILVAVILATIVFISLRSCSIGQARSHSGSSSLWNFRSRSNRTNYCSGAIAVLILTFFVFAPLCNIVYKSGIGTTHADDTPALSFSIFTAMSTTIGSISGFREEIGWSIQIALWASTVAIAGAAIGIIICQHGTLAKASVAMLGIISLSLPGPLLNQIAMAIFNRPENLWSNLYNDTLIPTVFCLEFRLMPVAFFFLLPMWLFTERRYGEMWQLETSAWSRARFRLIANSMWRPTIFAAIACAAVSVGELNSYLLVLPPGVTPLAMRIFDLLHYAVRFREAGLILLIMAAGSLLSLLFTRRFVL